jgi:hypothetical protein
MVTEKTVREVIWPVVEQFVEAVVAEDDARLVARLVPRSEAAVLHLLFGLPVFELLLKTVLGRDRLAVTRAIETEQGKYVHVEFVWPDPTSEDNSYTAADLVSVQLRRYRSAWRVVAVNPAAADFPLTEARAQGILLTAGRHVPEGQVPQEPWILPVALFAGNLQLPLRPEAVSDPVSALVLPGMQHLTYGVLSLAGAWRLWHDYVRAARPELDAPGAWAAAVEFIMSEQALRGVTQGAVGQHYGVSLPAMLPRIRQIKQSLRIEGLDARYSALGGTQIVLRDGPGGDEAA